jgi:hypothetical protein
MIPGRSLTAILLGLMMIAGASAQTGGMPQGGLPLSNLPPNSNVPPMPTTLPQASVPPMPTTVPQANVPSMSTVPPQQQAGKPPCFDEFTALKNEAQARAAAVQNAQKKKITAPEACQLLTRFTDAEAKFVSFAQKNVQTCGIPEQAVQQMKASHETSSALRKRVCDAATAQQQRPAGPSLSDALGTTRLPDTNSAKRGTGTFDTLTGSSLAR